MEEHSRATIHRVVASFETRLNDEDLASLASDYRNIEDYLLERAGAFDVGANLEPRSIVEYNLISRVVDPPAIIIRVMADYRNEKESS